MLFFSEFSNANLLVDDQVVEVIVDKWVFFIRMENNIDTKTSKKQ